MHDVHAPLPPSFAPVWGECSAAVIASQSAPDIETDAKRNGVAAHWVWGEVLLNIRDQRKGPTSCLGYLGRVAPNGVIVDEDMVEGAQVMVDDVLRICEGGMLPSLLIEHRVNMPRVHTSNWGTIDVGAYMPNHDLIYLWDYKYGHRDVRAKGHLQLIDYIEGLAEKFGINGAQDQKTTVVLRIVKPFCYNNKGPIDEWVGTLSDLRGSINKLHNQAHAAFNNPKMTTGKHCRDCPAVGSCSARRNADYNLIDLVNEPYEIDTMTARDLAVERRILKDGLAAGKERLEAIEENLKHRIRAGIRGTGLALESGIGRLKWIVPNAHAEALAAQFGFSIKIDTVKTPRQAEQAAPKELQAMFSEVLKTVTERPAGALKLINADDTVSARAFTKEKDNATI